MVTTYIPQLVNISAKHKAILDRIKQTHGLSIREQVEMGIDYLSDKFKVIDDPFRTDPQSQPHKADPIMVTSFAEWMQECAIKEWESGDIMYCVNNAPTTSGRFVTESNPDSGIFVRTIDCDKCILHLKSQKAISTFRIHLGNRSNYHQLEMSLSPKEEARVEHSLAELISDTKGTAPYEPAVRMGNEIV